VTSANAALLALRLIVGLSMLAHGLNHYFGGGRIPGAGRWFESLGLHPGRLHAWITTLLEVASGIGLAAGFLTPISAAAMVGMMTVAIVVHHRHNGFFVLKEGFEYVLMISVVVVAIATLGPGAWSIDHAAGIVFAGWKGAAIAGGAGLVGAALLLATSWRPPKSANAAAS
jgi:putative oxidoreductase